MIPLVSTRLSRIFLYLDGKSEPTIATNEVGANMLEESDAYVAAPPMILVPVLKGVRVVSRAIVPNTVIMF